MRITGLVPNAMADAWEQVFLSAREDDYMALMEATAARTRGSACLHRTTSHYDTPLASAASHGRSTK